MQYSVEQCSKVKCGVISLINYLFKYKILFCIEVTIILSMENCLLLKTPWLNYFFKFNWLQRIPLLRGKLTRTVFCCCYFLQILYTLVRNGMKYRMTCTSYPRWDSLAINYPENKKTNMNDTPFLQWINYLRTSKTILKTMQVIHSTSQYQIITYKFMDDYYLSLNFLFRNNFLTIIWGLHTFCLFFERTLHAIRTVQTVVNIVTWWRKGVEVCCNIIHVNHYFVISAYHWR